MYPGAWVGDSPDKPAVIMAESGAELSYRDLETRSIKLAHALRAHGLRYGDVVAFLMENSPSVFEVYWAAQRSGLYAVAINHHLSAAEVQYVVEDSGAKALVASAGKAELAVHGAQSPALELRLVVGGKIADFEDYEEVLAAMPDAPPADQPRGGDMLYSSGTTGRPKGIKPPLPKRQVHEPGNAAVRLFAPRYGLGRDTVYYSPAPLYHAAPLRFCAAVQSLGGTAVVSERFDPEGSLAAIERYRVTHSQWVPTMFVRLLRLPDEVRQAYDRSSMRFAIHAAAPCPVDVKRSMIEWWGPVLDEYYSSTESNGITFIDSQEWLRKPGSVGRGGAMGHIRICDDNGAVLPPGQLGTVYFERDLLPFTYHGDPEKTRRAQHPDHPTWTTSGDVGHVDEEGYLFLTDRKDFMIISGGVNIYPQEIENCLASHPDVLDVAVIGVPDAEMGEKVKAIVQPRDAANANAELKAELIAYTRERIAHYKAPKIVEFTDRLPRTPTGKLAKHQLRESPS
jgi:fatty-acyl-CoA synthase